MTVDFRRTVENFTCEKCGAFVEGDGYTDHCPICLWCKHVDIHPGDRAADCGGLMEPVAAEMRNTEVKIHYVCKKCGKTHRVRRSPKDSSEAIIRLGGNSFK